MRKFLPLPLAVAVSIFLPNFAFATELYSFVSNNCAVVSGLIVNIEGQTIHLIDLKGEARDILLADQEVMLLHNTVENPIPRIQLKKEILNRLKDVYVDDDDSPAFTGWPVKFVEEMVVFYATTGRQHVVEQTRISKIRPAKIKQEAITPPSSSEKLSFGDVLNRCPSLRSAEGNVVRPTQIIADKIQINEFVSTLEHGFRSLDSYEERTYLYSRPIVFDKVFRLGYRFPLQGGLNYNAPPNPAPIYFQWGSGDPYRFQSFNQIGGAFVEVAPTLESYPFLRSEVKSHFFHGVFLGNIPAIPAGTFYLHKQADDIYTGWNEQFRSALTLNYLAMLGVDFGRFSASFGSFYPVHMLVYKRQQFREIVASDVAPIFRFMFTHKKYRLRALGSIMSSDGRNDSSIKTTEDVAFGFSSVISEFNLKSRFIRLGGEYDFTDFLKLTADYLYFSGEYSEQFTRTNQHNSVDFVQNTSEVSISHSFGQYTNLRIFYQLHRVYEKYDFMGDKNSEDTSHALWGGQFEFLL